VHRILTEDLNMSKVAARWVPRILTEVDRQKRVQCSREFLKRYEAHDEVFFDRIVSTDETWLYYYDTESIWKSPDTPPPKKARVQRSAKMEMYIYFIDRHGFLLQHKVRNGSTVNAEYYSKVKIKIYNCYYSVILKFYINTCRSGRF
jgi:histone-lysine N-methyltransferase SETMAR